jgi:starch synthase (maltosyl-transferring)
VALAGAQLDVVAAGAPGEQLVTDQLVAWSPFYRPNAFANTPDILHEYLQHGGRPAFEVRLVLAATLAASYGIYSGYELCENVAVRPGSEEYLDSEKYEIKVRDWQQPGSLRDLIARVNQIRREYPALQFNDGLRFHETDNPALLFFSKGLGAAGDTAAGDMPDGPRLPSARRQPVFIVANTDPHHVQHGWIRMPSFALRAMEDGPSFALRAMEDGPSSALRATEGGPEYEVEDLLDGARYTWRGDWNYVRLDPAARMAHVFVVLRR